MLIDSHAHLYKLSDLEIIDVVNSASSAGVNLILNTSVDGQTSLKVTEQLNLSDSLFAAVGISPFDVENLSVRDFKTIESLLVSNKKVVAVGEIGVDSTNPTYPPTDIQWDVFKKMLDLAQRHSVPAIIHSRGSESEIFDYCLSIGFKNAVFHCYTGSEDLAGRIVSAGYYISLSGIVTFKNGNLDDVVKNIPLNRLLLETDSPYLAPVPLRGTKNEPANVSYTYKKVSKICGYNFSDLVESVENNFKELFALDYI